MRNTIVLFNTQLDTLNLFSKEMENKFIQLGYSIYTIELENVMEYMGPLYEKIRNNEVCAMIGFNSSFFGLKTPSGHNVWETLDVLCINILVDHPFWYHNILVGMPGNGAVLCIDRNHMKYVNRFYPNIGITGFLPHGGTDKNCKFDVGNRSIDVIYAGSLYVGSGIDNHNFSAWDFPAKDVCLSVIKFLKDNYSYTIEDAIESELSNRNIILSDDTLRVFISFASFIEREVSTYYRRKILESVAKAGINLTIVGSGWDKEEFIKLSNVHYKGLVSPEDVLDMMNDSKIILNSMPWFKDGGHERIFNGMLSGAVIATETNPYLKETLPKDSYIEFDVSDAGLEKLVKDIRRVLGDNELIKAMSEKSREFVLESQTWQCRANELHEDILKYIN